MAVGELEQLAATYGAGLAVISGHPSGCIPKRWPTSGSRALTETN
jgi:hypothetical protein